jgi:four helix bundle protein
LFHKMARDYRQLKAFTLADDLVMDIYKSTKSFPQEELFGLKSQMRRAAVSVPANIAEGSARPGLKNYLNFLGVALGSLTELGYYIDLSQRLGYLSEADHVALATRHQEAIRTLQALITALQKKL